MSIPANATTKCWRTLMLTVVGLLLGTFVSISHVRAEQGDSPKAGTASQTITFGAIANRRLGEPAFSVSAASSSGLPVTFFTTTSLVCAVSAATVSLIAEGTCTVVAAQEGDATFAAAPNVAQSFVVLPRLKTPTTTTLTVSTNSVVHFTPVTFVATVSSATGTPMGTVALEGLGVSGPLDASGSAQFALSSVPPGTYTVTARYAGNDFYDVSASAGLSLTVLCNPSLPGRLDGSFGCEGQVDLGGNAIAVQGDGKLLLAKGTGVVAYVTRLLPDGGQDSTFGSIQEGSRRAPLPADMKHVAGIAVDSSSRIYVAGDNLLTALTPDGALDPSFGVGGSIPLPQTAMSMVIQADGKVLVATKEWTGSSYVLSRFSSTGALDASFGSAGRITGPSASAENLDVALQADGKVLLLTNGQLYRFGIDGQPDPSFGENGVVPTSISGRVRATPAGRILVGGARLAQYLPTGQPDLSFGVFGFVEFDVADRRRAVVESLEVEANGSINAWVSAHLVPPGASVPVAHLFRFSGTGERLEQLFDVRGDPWTAKVLVQADEKVVIARPGASFRLQARGYSGFATLSASPSSVDFRGQARGSTSPPRRIVITNNGSSPLTIVSLTATTEQNAQYGNGSFVVSHSCATLQAGSTCEANVTFTAGGYRLNRGELTISSSAGDQKVALFGTPVESSTGLNGVPPSLDFGNQSMGTTSPSRTITLSPTGASIAVTSISATTHFQASHNCSVLEGTANCTVVVTFTPMAEGGLTGTLSIATNVGTQSVALTGTGEKSLVRHYYTTILRRAPDTSGKAFWDAETVRVQGLGVSVNEVWFAMASAFFNSPEHLAFGLSNTDFVTVLYETFFNRAADAAGRAYWVDQLSMGMPREVALASFMFSTEFGNFTQAIFGAATMRKEIDTVVDFYRGLLARLPENAGFNDWLQKFRRAQCEGSSAVISEIESISSQFTQSAEYLARNRSNSQYVGDLYNAFLRRGGDLSGVLYWIGQLDGGAQSREDVRKLFVASPEFQTRVAAIIGQGCAP